MSHYLEPDSHVRDKFKVVLDLTKYATKKKLKMLQVLINKTSCEKDLIALKAKVDKLNIDKLVNVPADLNSTKQKLMI